MLVGGAVALGEYALRLQDGQWINASTLGYPHALFAAALVVAGARAVRPATRRAGLAGLFLLGLAWCASLSIGFPTPLLFATPMLAIPAVPPTRDASEGPPILAAWAVVALAAVMAGLCALHPYEDLDARGDRPCPLGQVDPHLRLIVSGPRTCAKLAEYARLRRAYPGPFITLPGFVTSHLFAGDMNPLSADWPTLAEDAGASLRLQREADSRARYAFVEKTEAAAAEGDQQMPLLDHVSGRWTRVAEGEAYAVYRNPAR